MRFLEVELYDESGGSAARSISIVIRLRDKAGEKEDFSASIPNRDKQSRRGAGAAMRGDKRHGRSRKVSTRTSRDRLLPSDRLVLNALLARVPQGERVTQPVRLQELVEECEISRSQARICLKRLNERGLVSRLLDEVCSGNQEGYSYKISPEVIVLPKNRVDDE